ncbi:hypothetical protein AB0M39_02275 [Streptomyces sp. NPDC051907]|uniref:hypothetical protein n=1 Tax=Streptomyces sp. NPDC051907 TaxID=3155284 RepID=UPI0034289507
MLAALAAAVPPYGRILALGTSAGTGTAWIVAGLADREDVEVTSAGPDPATTDPAHRGVWPSYVAFAADETTALYEGSPYDLVFADAPGGTFDHLDLTVAALRPRGHLLVDDTQPAAGDDAFELERPSEIRKALLDHPQLISVELDCSTALVLSTRLTETD